MTNYSSLRIAAIEHYVAGRESLPFIADDLLVDFDDQRAAEALAILGELSEQTQVLFFTHHAHLVELAQKILGPTRVKTHELVLQLGSSRAGSEANSSHVPTNRHASHSFP